MVIFKEAKRGELFRTIKVDGFSDYTNPRRVRLSLYTMRCAIPETEAGKPVLEPAREVELVFKRETFMKFADKIARLRKWMEEHPFDREVARESVKDYIKGNFTSDEILAMWLGREVKVPRVPKVARSTDG